MSKKIAFTPPPKAEAAGKGDAWVKDRSADTEAEPLKRLQVDIPASLHARVKIGAVERGHRTMSDLVRKWLEAEFPPK